MSISRCLSTTTCALVVGMALGSTTVAAKGYYKWYDENGEVVYSQLPPGQGRDSQVVKPPPPPAESPEAARQRLQNRLQQFEDNREDQELARQEAQKQQSEAEQARQRCESARRNLQVLDGPARQLYQTPDGKVMRMPEEERQKRRAEMEKIIANDCK